jgi:phage-related protein
MSPTPERVRDLKWVGSAKKDLQAMPEDIQDVFGRAILDLELGDEPEGARPYGEGVEKEIWKIAEDYDGDTYRAAYTAHFPGVVYVLDVFKKKAKKGKATPKPHKDRVKARYQTAKKHYEANYLKPTTP